MRARLLVALLLLAAAAPAAGQDRGWNSERVMQLVQRAREARVMPPDSGLRTYRARAEGHVYFYLDREQTGERTLVKADQVALEMYWRKPHFMKQRIVGRRDESVLPNDMRYHLDHLTVVQNDFSDHIELGGGDEVKGVLHPAAPHSDTLYTFRLADSLTLTLPSSPQPIRVYDVQFRPMRMDRPAVIGSMYLDRATGAIVRLSFTFTPASYIDPRLQQIRISLDNGLWDGRYWLPDKQHLEIRRQIPHLDLSVSSVIAGSFNIRNYELNDSIPITFFIGPRIVVLPTARSDTGQFRTGLMAGLASYGLAEPPDFETLKRTIARMALRQRLNGLPKLRPYFPSVSSTVRYDRAEALYVGGGLSYHGDRARLDGMLGYATGPGQLHGSLRLRAATPGRSFIVDGYADALRDLGQQPGAPGALNTLSALLGGSDQLDPYFASGASATIAWRPGGGRWQIGAAATLEDDRAASLEVASGSFDHGFRPVRSIREGRLAEGRLRFARLQRDGPGLDWSGALTVNAGRLAGDRYVRPILDMDLRLRADEDRATVAFSLAAGYLAGDALPQRLFLLGGTGTLPGYGFRSFAGTSFALAEAQASHTLGTPLLRGRLDAAAGWARLDKPAPGDWPVTGTGRVRTSVGAGVGLFWDMLRLDLWRGLQGGTWQLVVSLKPEFRAVF
ncbi:MAG: hypothetical protein P8099_19490 [Gemmatimonadota bacterium]